MIREYTIPLTDAEATLGRAGGKGASLTRLAQAGLPVPGGFDATTAAYQQFVAENDLQPTILAAPRRIVSGQIVTVDGSAGTVNVEG